MQIRYAIGKEQFRRLTTEELRRHFLVENIFVPGKTELIYWETDRTVLGGSIPLELPLPLENDRLLAAEFFCERREMGIFNIGGPGVVVVDGERFYLSPQDALYVGRGSRDIVFITQSQENPARFFLISYPAHIHFQTVLISKDYVQKLELGTIATSNQRSLFQYVHEKGAQSCQLVTGITEMKPGSVWNTMPPHTHLRRSEVYMYFNLPENGAVFHMMGPQDETRHLIVKNEQAVLSPPWSIHSGCGTEAYSFIWAMGGENQTFTDMDGISISDLK